MSVSESLLLRGLSSALGKEGEGDLIRSLLAVAEVGNDDTQDVQTAAGCEGIEVLSE